MITFPNAKINLGLNILRKREDGFHDIETCFFPIPLYDALEVIDSGTPNFYPSGLSIPGIPSTNLCLKAYDLLHQHHRTAPVNIYLHKAIPIGAGLGGGSADGSFTLKMLNHHFQLRLSNEKLKEYALQLGSDCPFFIDNTTAIAKGRGEELSLVGPGLSSYWLAICNPGIHISTKEAYEGVIPSLQEIDIKSIIESPVSEWKDVLVNGFEASIFKKHPSIEAVRDSMYASGAYYASMTGTGPTVFGLFKERPNQPGWTVMKI